MEVTEIVVLVIGIIIFIASFIVPEALGKNSEEAAGIAKEEIKSMVSLEMHGIKLHVDEVVGEAIEYAVEKTERSLERLTNEKIMAVSEYSDTVLKEIHKNHEEALFLYDMLNSKHANLKETVSMINQTVKEAEETTKGVEAAVNSFQRLTPESVEAASVRPEETESGQMENVIETVKTVSDDSREEVVAKEAETESVDVTDLQSEDEDGLNKNDKILELHKMGISQVAIAKELGLGVGEVKLVIDLYKNA